MAGAAPANARSATLRALALRRFSRKPIDAPAFARLHAPTEPFSATIRSLKPTARGFRNFGHYRTRILVFLGKLNLSPL